MTKATQPAAAGDTAAAEETTDTRPKASAKVLTAARKLGKVIEHPTPEQIAENPNARGYDEHGHLRPADARAVYLVVPKAVEALADPTPEERGRKLRAARKAAAAARAKAEREKG